MGNISTKEKFQQAFYDLADEMEKECGDWQSLPDNPELTERILKAAQERLEQKS